jgi:uncharacterized protein with HEPN domain
MLKSDLVRLRHILDAAREAIVFCHGRTREELDSNRMLSLSLVRLLEIIGEAARGVSEGCRRDHPHIAWKSMAGMRDRLVHGYFDVNLEIVWETVTKDLPPLLARLEAILAEETE